jgi:hypothetical protein
MSETKLLIGNDMIASKNMLNPFVHHLELTSTYDKFKVSDPLWIPIVGAPFAWFNFYARVVQMCIACIAVQG